MSDPNPSPMGHRRPATLAILGASARAAAGSALRAGFVPITADLFADRDLERKCTATSIHNYPWAFDEWLAHTDADGWMFTGGLENYPELVERMSSRRPLWGNPAEVLRAVRSPWNLATAIGAAGLLFPELQTPKAAIPADGTWLLKSGRGSSGSGVQVWDKQARQRRRSTAYVMQQRVEGLPIAALFVAARGKAVLLGVTEQLVGTRWTHARAFQYCGSLGPWPAKPAQLAAIRAVGRMLAEKFRLVGLFGVDMIAAADGVWTIEVNPRYTASVEVLERALGLHALDWHLGAWREGAVPQDTASSNTAAGKAILFARTAVRISERFVAWADAGSRLEPWPAVADVPHPGTAIPAGRPVVTVLATGSDAENVRAALRQRILEAEIELYQ